MYRTDARGCKELFVLMSKVLPAASSNQRTTHFISNACVQSRSSESAKTRLRPSTPCFRVMTSIDKRCKGEHYVVPH